MGLVSVAVVFWSLFMKASIGVVIRCLITDLRCSWLDGLIDTFCNSGCIVRFITVELMKSIQKAIWLLGKSASRYTVRVIENIDLNFSYPLICWFEMELDETLVNHWYYSN